MRQIAAQHHEKPDGSGYPAGLGAPASTSWRAWRRSSTSSARSRTAAPKGHRCRPTRRSASCTTWAADSTWRCCGAFRTC
ncbi:MAG: hypothetical protein KGK10_03695 [Rhodospirillales bacterium]|nr:hypothetical protein [Rhodospirillales bacterium]